MPANPMHGGSVTDKKCNPAPIGRLNFVRNCAVESPKSFTLFRAKKVFWARKNRPSYVLEILDLRRESINCEICLPHSRCLCSASNKKKNELFWKVKRVQ